MAKKSWLEKLKGPPGLPKVVALNEATAVRWNATTCVVPAPQEVDRLMKKVRKGRLVTVNDIREVLAQHHGAEIACPMTTGIHVNIVANAAVESQSAGARRITPYWRTLKNKGELNAKFPGGAESHARHLEEEGHTIQWRGKRAYVVEFEKRLQTLDGSALEES